MNRESPDVHAAVLELLGRAGTTTRVTLTGTSMTPTLPAGSSLVLRHGSRGVRVGSLVAYLLQGQGVVHRVVRIRRQGERRELQTQGDAVNRPDAWIGEEQVLAVVIAAGAPGAERSLEGPWARLRAFLRAWRLRRWSGPGGLDEPHP